MVKCVNVITDRASRLITRQSLETYKRQWRPEACTLHSQGNVSELHICESDALVDLFGYWLVSSKPESPTVSL